MRSKVAERILANTPEEVKVFARIYGDLVVRINLLIKEKGYTQKVLAEFMTEVLLQVNDIRKKLKKK